MIPFPPFQPDLHDWNLGRSTIITNVRPTADGYIPFRGPAAYSGALAAPCEGQFTAKDSSGNIYLFAATDDNLYKLNSSTYAWDDVSRGSAYTGGGSHWWFCQFGDHVIAVNGVDNVQTYQLGVSALFGDLAGSPPVANGCAVVGDFLVLWYGRTVRWSGLNDHTYWTIGKKKSDLQVFPDGGDVRYVSSGEAHANHVGGGTIIQEGKIRQMMFQPTSPAIFSFAIMESSRGSVSALSCGRIGARVFFLDEDGFYMWDGAQAHPIGAEKVDRSFLKEVDSGDLANVQVAIDAREKQVLWRYPTSAVSGATYSDRILCYDWQLSKWTRVELDCEWIAPAATAGIDLDSIDGLGYNVDDFPGSFDDAWLKGGRPTLAVFTSASILAWLTGDTLEATLETNDVNIIPGRRATVHGWRPIVDTSAAAGTVGCAATHSGTLDWNDEATMSRDGRVYGRCDGLIHRFRLRIPAATEWAHVAGVSEAKGDMIIAQSGAQ